MSPSVQLVASPPPSWPFDMYFPDRRTALGTTPDVDDVGSIPNESLSGNPDVSGGTSASVGATHEYQIHQGRMAARVVVAAGAVNLTAAFQFPWWSPFWGPASAVASGLVNNEQDRVAIFDVWLSFNQSVSRYLPGGSGFFFVSENISTGISSNERPNGATPQTVCGFEFVDDGSGNQSVRWRSYNAAGAILTQSALPATFTPQDWNHLRMTLVSAAPGREAQVFEARINDELLVSELAIDDVQVLRPQTIRPAAGQNLYMMASCERDTGSPQMFYTWRARFGAFRPDGVEVRS